MGPIERKLRSTGTNLKRMKLFQILCHRTLDQQIPLILPNIFEKKNRNTSISVKSCKNVAEFLRFGKDCSSVPVPGSRVPFFFTVSFQCYSENHGN